MGDADKLPGRRSFLRGVAGGVAGGVVAGGAAGYAVRASQPEPAMAADTASLDGRLAAVPFHGRYQAGIVPPSQRQTAVISFDVTADSTSGLTDLFQTITSRARFLTAGGTPPPVGIDGPPSDSGVLGPTVVPDGLTVTFGVGSTLFDDRYGLAGKLPGRLTPMQPFPNDDLDPAQTGGDLILQLSAGNADTVLHALRDIAKHTRGGMQINWRIDGFTSPARPSGTVPRNLMGFMDGIANPPLSKAKELLWVQPGTAGEPDWTADGSYFVVRLIRMFVEFWDRVDVYEQQQMIGRDRATGFPLDARSLFAAPDFGADPTGAVIPVNAHIRLANPRTPQTAVQPDPAPRLQLRPRHRPGRRPGPGADLHVLPAGREAAVRGGPDAADRRAAGRLHQPVRRRLLPGAARCPRHGRLVRPRAANVMGCRVLAIGWPAVYISRIGWSISRETVPGRNALGNGLH